MSEMRQSADERLRIKIGVRSRISECVTRTQIISLSSLPSFLYLSSTSHSSVSWSSSSSQAHRISIFYLQHDSCICLHFRSKPIDQVFPSFAVKLIMAPAPKRLRARTQVPDTQVPGTPENHSLSGSSLSGPPSPGDHSPSPALSRRPPSPPPSRPPPRTPSLQDQVLYLSQCRTYCS